LRSGPGVYIYWFLKWVDEQSAPPEGQELALLELLRENPNLEGETHAARSWNILYTEPWVYHGLTNTGTEQLIFVVVRFNSKGITVAPRPDNRPDEQ
jgi:hypothetical protein